jgi:general secretion pathway protein G
MEHELRQVGIEVIYFKTKVINKQIVITDKDTPIFYVKANTYKHPHLQLYSYGCKVALIERVSLKRAGSVTCLSQTWWTPILVGTVNKEDMPVAIQSRVAGQLSDFIDDYLESNARMSSRNPEDIAEQLNKMRLKITKARHKILHAAVTVFKLDTGHFPTQEKGLHVLIEPPGGCPIEPGRYLENTEQLKDGWGNNFYYILYPESGKPFIIISFGADGKEGGDGYDADWP